MNFFIFKFASSDEEVKYGKCFIKRWQVPVIYFQNAAVYRILNNKHLTCYFVVCDYKWTGHVYYLGKQNHTGKVNFGWVTLFKKVGISKIFIVTVGSMHRLNCWSYTRREI